MKIPKKPVQKTEDIIVFRKYMNNSKKSSKPHLPYLDNKIIMNSVRFKINKKIEKLKKFVFKQ